MLGERALGGRPLENVLLHTRPRRRSPKKGNSETFACCITTQLMLATCQGIGRTLCIRSIVPSVWRVSTANGKHSASDPSCLRSAGHSASDPSCPPCGAFRRQTASTLHLIHRAFARLDTLHPIHRALRVAPFDGKRQALCIRSIVALLYRNPSDHLIRLARWQGVGWTLCIRSIVPSVWRLSTAHGKHSALVTTVTCYCIDGGSWRIGDDGLEEVHGGM